MKLITAALALVWLAAGADTLPSPQQPRAPTPEPALRQVLHEVFRQDASPPPRQLSAVERAELRRQLNEYGRPQPRNP